MIIGILKTFEKYEGCPQSNPLILSTNADNKMFSVAQYVKIVILEIVYISNFMRTRIPKIYVFLVGGGESGGLLGGGGEGADW